MSPHFQIQTWPNNLFNSGCSCVHKSAFVYKTIVDFKKLLLKEHFFLSMEQNNKKKSKWKRWKTTEKEINK